MDRLESGIQEPIRYLFYSAEYFGGDTVFVIARLEAHDADVFDAKALHSGNRPFDLGKGDIEGITHLLGPVHDGGAEAISTDARGLQLPDGEVKGFVRYVVEVGFGEAGDLDAPGFEELPSQFLRSQDLAVDAIGALVADAHVFHSYLLNDAVKSSLETSTTFFSSFDEAIN
jgi:hypothetical protein